MRLAIFGGAQFIAWAMGFQPSPWQAAFAAVVTFLCFIGDGAEFFQRRGKT